MTHIDFEIMLCNKTAFFKAATHSSLTIRAAKSEESLLVYKKNWQQKSDINYQLEDKHIFLGGELFQIYTQSMDHSCQ